MRTRLIAVVGSGGGISEENAKLAEALGAALVREGFGIVCGGLGGVMEAACRGAVRERGKALHPPIVGLLPKYDVTQGNAYLDVAIPTGLGHARNVLVASSGEVVLCIGGATGALSEVALARKIGRPVIVFRPSGGTAALVGKTIGSVTAVDTVPEAVAKIRSLLPG
jgi:uncharacterized protein (TIGR00725 family)